ncbi:hypothetical protein ILYODFUR_022694 [Ilyodon furcidens]|uniref:Uncharacterized protein n=1 Tax=Ilyodon furcidens TaxID=33524 RepID=A0ABV0SZA8_9TELE
MFQPHNPFAICNKHLTVPQNLYVEGFFILVTRNNQQSLPDEVHNAEMPEFATAHCAQYHQLQAPQHVQQLPCTQTWKAVHLGV